MKQYDFRFDTKLIKSFIGKTFTKYKHADFVVTDSVTGILEFEIDQQVFELVNDYEALDYFGLDGEATIFSISASNWTKVESMINDDIKETYVNALVQKVILVNDHTFSKNYDMWETKAIVFCFKNFEICFEKQDCWFSMEIEIHKGHDTLNMIDDGKDILNDFDGNPFVSIERTIVEIV